MPVTFIPFRQDDLIRDYQTGIWHLNKKGVCWGLCLDFYRFYKKLNTQKLSLEKLEKKSFLYKAELQQYVNKEEVPKHNQQKAEKSFARRIQFYQFLQNRANTIDKGTIKDFDSFKSALEQTNYLSITVSDSLGSHAISIATLRDKEENILEYRLIEPNKGEYHCTTIEELDDCFKKLMQKSTYTDFKIEDSEEIFKNYDLINNKWMFYSLEEMDKLKSLNKEALTRVFKPFFDTPDINLLKICKIIPQDPEIMKHILKEIGDLFLSSSDSIYSVLEFAIRNKDKDLLNHLLTNYQKFFAAPDKNGYTPLHWAIVRGDHEIAEALITTIAPKDIIRVDYKALYLALAKDNHKIIEALVKKMNPADLAVIKEVFKELPWAILNNRTEMAQALINVMSPEELRTPDKNGNIALHSAIKKGRTNIAETIVKKMSSEDFAIKDKDELTPLHWAVAKGNGKIAMLLIDKMDQKDLTIEGEGNNALHYAAENGHIEIVSKLIEKMTPEQLALPNEEGYTTLHLALREDHIEIAEALLGAMDNKDILKIASLQQDDEKESVLDILEGKIILEDNENKKSGLVKIKSTILTHLFLEESKNLEPLEFITEVTEFNKVSSKFKFRSWVSKQDSLDKNLIAKYLNEPYVPKDVSHITPEDKKHGYIEIKPEEDKELTRLDIVIARGNPQQQKAAVEYYINLDSGHQSPQSTASRASTPTTPLSPTTNNIEIY